MSSRERGLSKKPNGSSISQSSTESRAIYAAFLGGGLGFLIGLVSFWGHDVSLFERGISLGFVGSILGGVTALITFLIVTILDDKMPIAGQGWQRLKDMLSMGALALVHGLLIFLSYAMMFYVIKQSFRDATIDVWAASVILALSTGFAAYIVYLSAASMTAVRVSMLLALFLVSGALISMLTSSDPHWWYKHFSSLGAGSGVSGYAFNATLIIAGLVIVALTHYISEDFNRLKHSGTISQRSKVGILQGLLTGVGLMLAFVGMFVYDQFPLIHNSSAGGMAVMFLAIVTLLPVLTPGFTRAFFVASYALLAVLAVCYWLASNVHYLNLTMFELISASVIFIWVVIFVRHLAAMLDDEASSARRPSK